MSLLLVGDRPDVLLLKYQLLNKNWQLDISQAYSFEQAESLLGKQNFSCLIYASPSKASQTRRLLEINQKFNIPVKVLAV